MLFLLLFPVFFLGAVVALTVGVICGGKEGVPVAEGGRGKAIRLWFGRWMMFVACGLRPLRVTWWEQWSLEGSSRMWRYVLLLEYFELCNLKRAARRRGRADGMRNVLIVVLGHIGDILHASPAVRALRDHEPNAQVSLLVGPWSEDIARNACEADYTITYAPSMEQYHRGKTASVRGWFSEMRFLQALRQRSFDTLITVSNTGFLEFFLSRAIAPKRWVGTQPRPSSYAVLWEEMLSGYSTRTYEADRIMRLVEPLGVSYSEPVLEYEPSEGAQQRAKLLLEDEGVAEDARLVAVAPGGGWPGKLWPEECFADVSDWLSGDLGFCVVLIGSLGERSMARSVLQHMWKDAVDLVGRTSLDECAALLGRCDLLLCNDAGPLHVAAAMGVPTVSLFGPTYPEQWAPRGTGHTALSGKTRCEGCWPWHPRARCRHDRKCMREISVAAVKEAISSVLKEPRA